MRILTFYSVLVIACSSCAPLVNHQKAIAYVQRKLDKQTPGNHGSQPDYGNLKDWAASPFKIDSSDFIPEGVKQTGYSKNADVFFIHPTTYISSNGNAFELSDLAKKPFKGIRVFQNSPWNADIDDETVNIKTDTLSITNQATPFNESCRVFAPRYRQANIKAFIVPKESSNAISAFDLAYQDVKNAFQYYLENYNQERPIVIASHSQGTLLAVRLLKDFFDEKPLLNKLVCAYLVGYKVTPGVFKTIPVGETPHQTACVIGWQSFNADADFTSEELLSYGNTIAVNPVSWTTDHEWTATEKHKGTLIPNGTIISGKISARIDKHGLLMVKNSPEMQEWLKGSSNFHVWDYNLFWMDIRENVAERIAEFYK